MAGEQKNKNSILVHGGKGRKEKKQKKCRLGWTQEEKEGKLLQEGFGPPEDGVLI
jgi:hypothetical protein